MMIRGVLVEPGKPPLEAEIDTQYLSQVIGEKRLLVRPFKDREVGIVCCEDYANESAGLEYNRTIGSIFRSVTIYGPMFVAGLEIDGTLEPLTDQQVKQYLKQLAK